MQLHILVQSRSALLMCEYVNILNKINLRLLLMKGVMSLISVLTGKRHLPLLAGYNVAVATLQVPGVKTNLQG